MLSFLSSFEFCQGGPQLGIVILAQACTGSGGQRERVDDKIAEYRGEKVVES